MKFSIDLSDLTGSRKLMDEFGDSTVPFFGHNDEGETTMTSITHESIVMQTYQDNGWIRENWLHYDGTREETFKGRWAKKFFTVTMEITASDEHSVHRMIEGLLDDDRVISYKIEEQEG